MAASSGTERLESADEHRIIHVNAYSLYTDPFVLDSIDFNGELVSQYPRSVELQPTANIINAGDSAFNFFDWNLLNLGGTNTFLTKIPSIDYTTEINRVTGSTDQLFFPKGGYWLLFARCIFLDDHTAINTVVNLRFDFSANSGGTFTNVGTGISTQPAVVGPISTGVSANFQHYFPETGVPDLQRVRIGVATSQAMPTGMTLLLRCMRLR